MQHYTRRTESFGKENDFYKVFHSTIQAYIDFNDLQEEVDKSNNVDEVLPDFLVTAHKISSEKEF